MNHPTIISPPPEGWSQWAIEAGLPALIDHCNALTAAFLAGTPDQQRALVPQVSAARDRLDVLLAQAIGLTPPRGDTW